MPSRPTEDLRDPGCEGGEACSARGRGADWCLVLLCVSLWRSCVLARWTLVSRMAAFSAFFLTASNLASCSSSTLAAVDALAASLTALFHSFCALSWRALALSSSLRSCSPSPSRSALALLAAARAIFAALASMALMCSKFSLKASATRDLRRRAASSASVKAAGTGLAAVMEFRRLGPRLVCCGCPLSTPWASKIERRRCSGGIIGCAMPWCGNTGAFRSGCRS
mmetsp:Transcript_26707/g.61534  ORF Transcript_26707/g.61534 Transcript_26707/m.61534 type:complete len:225 (+) Transcript_26707:979-1653(+)